MKNLYRNYSNSDEYMKYEETAENENAFDMTAKPIIGNKIYLTEHPFSVSRGFEREICMGDTKVHVKSIFNGYTTLDNAIKNIVMKKMHEAI